MWWHTQCIGCHPSPQTWCCINPSITGPTKIPDLNSNEAVVCVYKGQKHDWKCFLVIKIQAARARRCLDGNMMMVTWFIIMQPCLLLNLWILCITLPYVLYLVMHTAPITAHFMRRLVGPRSQRDVKGTGICLFIKANGGAGGWRGVTRLKKPYLASNRIVQTCTTGPNALMAPG